MMRWITILIGLSCAILAGCKAEDKGSAREPGAEAALHGANQDVTQDAKGRALCLTNLDGGLTRCGPDIGRQQRLVLIRNVVLPAED